MKKIWKKSALLPLLFTLSSATPVKHSFIYLLTQQKFQGDRNAALGIANALQGLKGDFDQVEFDSSKKDQFLQAVKQELVDKPGNKAIIIAVGDYSVEALKDLKPRPNIIIVHSSHQWTEKHAHLNNIASFVALPKHTVTPSIQSSMSHAQIIPTIGVAHNLTSEQIRQEYEQHGEAIPKRNKYIGVILGGDAPTPDGSMRYFTSEEARQLASYLANQVKWKKVHLLILNGPRTGQYDPQTNQELKESHRDGHIDPVTTAFIAELEKRKLINGTDFTLIDFQFGQPSLLKAVFGVLLATQSPLYVPGESTTNISEATVVLPGLVTVYKNDAMNTNHDAHVTSEQEAGHVNVLTIQDGKWIVTKASRQNAQNNPPAAQTIAEIVFKRFQAIPN